MNFIMFGVGGFVAPRHLQAISGVGGNLLAALDPNDSVGVLDTYFPECDFFTSYERFERHVNKLIRVDNIDIDYCVVCTPNHLHDSHIRFALGLGINVICEKPICIKPKNLDLLRAIELESGARVSCILQLRLHSEILKLKDKLSKNNSRHKVSLRYITSRGKWYSASWKGDYEKSGGLLFNIGIHLFDMLIFLFGDVEAITAADGDHERINGELRLRRADVKWFLSTSIDDIPDVAREQGARTWRSVMIDEDEIEFSSGFTDLHCESYRKIVDGNGFGINTAKASLELVSSINRVLEK